MAHAKPSQEKIMLKAPGNDASAVDLFGALAQLQAQVMSMTELNREAPSSATAPCCNELSLLVSLSLKIYYSLAIASYSSFCALATAVSSSNLFVFCSIALSLTS